MLHLPRERIQILAPKIGLAVHWLFLIVIYSFLASKAFLQFSLNGDMLAFHLPRSLAYFDLTTYSFGFWAEGMDAGYPALPNIIQGLLVWITGRISAANAVNFIGFAWAVGWICILYGKKFSLRWFLSFCLLFPLFYFHMTIGFIDLFTASMTLLGFAGLYGVITGYRVHFSAILMIAGLTLAMFSKMTAWPIVAVLALAGFYQLWRAVTLKRLHTGWALLFSLLLLAGSSYFPARNYYLFDNPTYPIELKTVMYTFPTVQIVSRIEQPNFPPYMKKKTNQSQFLSSLLESNRTYKPIPFDWRNYQNHGRLHERDHAGGLNSISVVAVLVLLVAGFSMGWIDKTSLTIGTASAVVVAVLPHYAILRYALFLPLASAFLICVSFHNIPLRFRVMIGCGVWVIVGTIAAQIGSTFWSIDARAPESFASTAARNYWSDQQTSQRGPQITTRGAYPATIFWSGPTFSEYLIKEDLENHMIDPRLHIR